MPRKNNDHIRTIPLRLDVSKPDEAAIYAHYVALTSRGHGSQWIRDVLAKALMGDSTPHAREIAPKEKTFLPPGYAPRQKSNAFNRPRPIPAVVGRKTADPTLSTFHEPRKDID